MLVIKQFVPGSQVKTTCFVTFSICVTLTLFSFHGQGKVTLMTIKLIFS